MSDSVRPHGWQPTRLPCPWDSPGKNTGVGCHCLLHPSSLLQLTRGEWHIYDLEKRNNPPKQVIWSSFPCLFIFKNFYWSIVDLQCCASIVCTAKWISYADIYIYLYRHSFLDSFCIWSSFRKLFKVRTCPVFVSFNLLSVFQESLAVKG